MANYLEKLPWYAQIGAVLAVGIGGCVAFYMLYEQPQQVEMAARQTTLKSLQADINKGQATARQLPQFQSEVTDLQARLDSLRNVLPEEKDTADLLKRMQTAASQASLEIKKYQPQSTVAKELHAELPVNLTLVGTYHNLAIFFDKVGKLPRIVNISNVVITVPSDFKPGGPTINADCVATTFILKPDEKAAPKPGAKPAAAPAAPAKGA